MDKIEYLKAARALITNPENFTTGDWARDVHGESVDVNDTEAICFCTLGAMRKISYTTPGANMSVKYDAEQYLYNYASAHGMTIAAFNDTHGHTAVLDMFDTVIKHAESDTAADS